MHTESFIVGKDASLEHSISTLQGRLEALGFKVEEHSWLNPVDGVWSVHLRDSDCPLMFTKGMGATKLAARASALGAFVERLACNDFWRPYYLGQQYAEGAAGRSFVHYPQEQWCELGEEDAGDAWPETLLTAELQTFYNPNGTIPAYSLVDFNSGNFERGICTLPCVRQRDQAVVQFPVNIIANLYASNGMSAGNTPAEARTQALSEIFERHIQFRVISEGLCLPDVPDDVIARYPHIAAGIAGLRAAGFGILVKDASLGGKYPVMNLTLLHPQDKGCVSSFGAHPRFEIALERALTELLRGRALDSLSGFPEAGFDLEEIASAPNIERHFVDASGIVSWNFLGSEHDFPFCDWNFSTTTAEDCAWLVNAIHAMDRDIYVADFSHLGVYACRIIVPGLSEIYPLDELEFENNSVANGIREAILFLSDLDDEECTDLLETLNESGLADARPVAPLIGLAPGDDPFWKDLRVGELKTLLALAAGDDDAVVEGCEWIRDFEQINPERRKVYSCIECLTKLNGDIGFAPALNSLYGAETVATAIALLDGELRFFGQPSPGLSLDGCDTHQRLLTAYGKLHA